MRLLAEALEGVKANGSALEVASCVLSIERCLLDAGRLAPSWPDGALQRLWRAAMSASALGGGGGGGATEERQLASVASALAVLQHHVVPANGGIKRQLFLRELREARCHLTVPTPAPPAAGAVGGARDPGQGGYVVALRTPLMTHLAKHSRPAAQDADISDVALVSERMRPMRSSRRYKVLAVTFRR